MKTKLTTMVLLAFTGGIIFFADQNVAKADEIDQLVADLSNTNRLWSWNSGGFTNLGLPATASTDDVIKRIFEMSLPKGQEADHKILMIRQVHIPNGVGYISNVTDSDLYTAAVVLKDGSNKIVFFKYWGSALGWWSRVYDSKSEAIGRIDMSVKGAKCKTEFVWPKHGKPEIVLEHSDVNAVNKLTEPHVPFVIQIEISDKQSGQTVMSNSVVAMDMVYNDLPMPSDTIRIDDYHSAFEAGHSYILFLQVLQETKGLGVADVYLK